MQKDYVQTKGERTREAILLESGRLFSARGFYGTGIEDIARELKIARGTLYQYFGSKERLLVEVLLWSEACLIRKLKGLAIRGATDPEILFGEIIRVFLEHSRSSGDLFGIYFSVNPEVTEGYREENLPPFTRIIAMIEDLLLSCGAPYAPDLKCFELGTLAFMAIESIRIAEGLHPLDSEEDALIRRRARLFLNGVLSGNKEERE